MQYTHKSKANTVEGKSKKLAKVRLCQQRVKTVTSVFQTSG